MEFIEDLSPAQLRALLPKVMSAIRSRRASLLAELENMGGQAPTTADFPEPSRHELEREANAAALQQLILRTQSQWQEERASLKAAIEAAGSERVRAARPPAASGGPPSKRRRSVETSTPCGEGASLGEMYQKLVIGNSDTNTNSPGPAGSSRGEALPRAETQIMRFRGKSGTSHVNVSLRRGQLSPQGLARLRAAFAVEITTPLPPSKNTPGDAEVFFRMSDKVCAQKTNGGYFDQVASDPARQWLLDLRQRNQDFLEAFAPLAGETYRTNAGPKPAWDGQPADALFGLGCIVTRLGAKSEESDEGMHVDGGPSLLFLAISLSGDRIVEFEEADGRRQRLMLREGDWYLSSPACIRHRVVRASDEPSTTLLLRAAVLARRASEMRVFGTKACFERLAVASAEAIQRCPFLV